MENNLPPTPEQKRSDEMMLNMLKGHRKEMADTLQFINGVSKAVSAVVAYGRSNQQRYDDHRMTYQKSLHDFLNSTNDFNEKIIFLEKQNIELKKLIADRRIKGYTGELKHYTSLRENLLLPLIDIVNDEAKLAVKILLNKPTPTVDEIVPVQKSAPKINLPGTVTMSKQKGVFCLSWNLDPKMITAIIDLLIAEKAFRPDDRAELVRVFHGEKRIHSHKIVCFGLQKRLPTVFFELKNARKITSQKKEITVWIESNFTYQATPNEPAQDFSLSTVTDALNESKPKKRIPNGGKQYINVLSLFVPDNSK